MSFLVEEWDRQSVERVKRERERALLDRWQYREDFANRIQAMNHRAARDPEAWLYEILETAEVLG